MSIKGGGGYSLQGAKIKPTPGMSKNFIEPKLDNTGYRDASQPRMGQMQEVSNVRTNNFV